VTEQNLEEFRCRIRQYQASQNPQKRRWYQGRKPGPVRVFSFPFSATMHVISLVFVLKALLMLNLGETRYMATLERNPPSGLGAQIGQMVMRPDRVSQQLHDLVLTARPLLAQARGYSVRNRAVPGRVDSDRMKVWSLWPTKKKAAPKI
jgi:hypothetical protein